MAEFLQQGEGRIDHARAGAVGAAELVLDGLDQLVAMARLLRDQRQDDVAQVALVEYPAAPVSAFAPVLAMPAIPAAAQFVLAAGEPLLDDNLLILCAF